MAVYDLFVKSSRDIREDQEMEVAIRDLTPGRGKYTYKYVRAKLSADPQKYKDTLIVRLGRGQVYSSSYSIEIVEEIPRLPSRYH